MFNDHLTMIAVELHRLQREAERRLQERMAKSQLDLDYPERGRAA